VKDVNFGFGKPLGTGPAPSIALDRYGNVVLVHEAPDDVKRCRLGQLNQATITWKTCRHSDHGVAPRVALNNRNLAVEVHRNPKHKSLHVRAGWMNFSQDHAEWHPADPYAVGDVFRAPAVAVNDKEVVVEVHEVHQPKKKKWLEFATGKVSQFPRLNVKWSDPRLRHAEGLEPAIAINNHNTVVGVYRYAYKEERTVFYTIGHADGTTLTLEKPRVIRMDLPPPNNTVVNGLHPSVALTDDGLVIVVMQARTERKVLELVGQVSGDRKSITWNRWWYYDEGTRPSVAAAGSMAVEFHSESPRDREMRFSTSLITDRASWMRDRLGTLGRKPLRDLVLPASHDAAMYRTDVPLAPHSLNQNLSVYQQLRYGIRYFDLRPMWLLGRGPWTIHHENIPGPSVQTVLDDVRKFANEVHDGRDHQELVILKLSHFVYADNNHYRRLAKQVTDTIGPWLVKSKPSGKRFADVTLNEFVKDGPAVLVVVDKNFAIDNPREGVWVYRDWSTHCPAGELPNCPRDLCVHDSYSKTENLGTMRNGQLRNFAAFNGRMQHYPDKPCDLFLLSWTLTPLPDSIPNTPTPWQLARRSNPSLGEEIRSDSQPPGISIPNAHGKIVNLVYVDYVESARVTDVALFLNGERTTTTGEPKPRQAKAKMPQRAKTKTSRQAKTTKSRRAKAPTPRRAKATTRRRPK
jgi:hypothetical protein